MAYEFEKNLELHTGHPFKHFKEFLETNPDLVAEIETAMKAVLTRIDPSDRGIRFVTGAAFEWILAAACGVAGISTLPGGHSENGYDLLALRENMKGLWSVKSSSTSKLSSFRLTNTMNNANAKFETPTIFIHPKLPGLVYLDPQLSPKVANKVKIKKDAIDISGSLINNYAIANPKLVAPLKAPINENLGKGDPYLDFVSNLLTAGNYQLLGPIMNNLKENSKILMTIRSALEQGILSTDQYQQMLDKLITKKY